MAHKLQYDVNCSILLTQLPIGERAAAARRAGFDAVEYWWPFSDAVPPDREVDAFLSRVRDAGVKVAGLNFYAGDMPGGDRGLVSWPGRHDEFGDNIAATIAIGSQLGCTAFNALYGNRIPGVAPEQQDEIAVENLSRAAHAAESVGARVLLEPVSGIPHYPIKTAADALAVMERVKRQTGASNIDLLADLYHLAVNGDDVDAVIADYAAQIGHVQIADAPGRHEPGSGDLPLEKWLDELERAGYRGWVGLEYLSQDGESDSFAWLPRERRGRVG